MNSFIKHIWFDFSDTLTFINEERHRRLRYESYAEAKGVPMSEKVVAEYEQLRTKYHSHSAVFCSLGLPGSYWLERIASVAPEELYRLADLNIPKGLSEIGKLIPISLFTNVKPGPILQALGIDRSIFRHIVEGGMVKAPKPALEGFYKMIDLTGLPAKEILYIGDDVEKDIRPAKTVGIQAGIVWNKSNEADYQFEKFEDILAFTLNGIWL